MPETSTNTNLAFEKLNEEKKVGFFQSETFKTLLTIIVILLIPVAAFAWNFFTGRDGVNQLRQVLNLGPSENEGNSSANGEEEDDDELAQNDQGQVQGQGATSPETGGPKPLANTSSKVNYVVKKGDTVENISRTVCKDLSFYAENLNLVVQEGEVITVRCNN